MEQYKRLSDYKPPLPQLRVGGEVEAWCTRCKQIENHTVLALQDNRPLKVMCNICRSQHNFKSDQGRSASIRKKEASSSAAKKKSATSQDSSQPGKSWFEATQDKDLSNSVAYQTEQSYEAGQVILHSKFGQGVVINTKEGNKINVVFKDKMRILIHARIKTT